MNIEKLMSKLPEAQRLKVRVINEHVVYDNGTQILYALKDEVGELVPMNQATKTALQALEGS